MLLASTQALGLCVCGYFSSSGLVFARFCFSSRPRQSNKPKPITPKYRSSSRCMGHFSSFPMSQLQVSPLSTPRHLHHQHSFPHKSLGPPKNCEQGIVYVSGIPGVLQDILPRFNLSQKRFIAWDSMSM